MSIEQETQAGREWARRLLGKSADAVTEEARKAEIRAQVEAEMAEYDTERQARQAREGGQRMAENALRHRRAVERPRDPLPGSPVGSTRAAPDGTIWKRIS